MEDNSSSSKIIAVVGPTASGKTVRGVDIARRVGGEIVSGDSRQIYRGMDIGTGKDLDEYGEIPYHLIDIAPAGYRYNLYEYVRDARAAVRDIVSRGKVPVVVGGTGLYVETLLKGLDLPEVPENTELRASLEGKSLDELAAVLRTMKRLHNVTDIDTPKRAVRAIEIADYYRRHSDLEPTPANSQPLDALIIHVDIDRESRRLRISERLHARLKAGMVDEVRRLIDSGVSAENLMYYGLEYKFVTQYVVGLTDYDTMVTSLEMAIHQFAKRQATWFRGMERRGFTLHSLPHDLDRIEFVDRVVKLWESV